MTTPPPKAQTSGFVKFVLVVLVLSVIIGICGEGSGVDRQVVLEPNLPSTVEVVLEIHGVGDITYNNASGNTEQRHSVGRSGAWTTVDEYSVDRGEFLYVSIQNAFDRGTVQCRIIVDNETVEEARSDGAYVIATCSGSA